MTGYLFPEECFVACLGPAQLLAHPGVLLLPGAEGLNLSLKANNHVVLLVHGGSEVLHGRAEGCPA